MVQFREHRGQLAESLTTVVKVKSKVQLAAHIRRYLSGYPSFRLDVSELIVELYVDFKDERCGWKKTYVVYRNSGVLGYGVFGFTDGPLK